MIKKLLNKFFKKNAKNPAVSDSSNGQPEAITPEVAPPSGFKQKISNFFIKPLRFLNDHLQVIRLSAHALLAALCLIICAVFAYSSMVTLSEAAIKGGQSIMLNVVNNEVFVGSLYKQSTQPQDSATTAPEKPFSDITDQDPSRQQMARKDFRARSSLKPDDKRVRISILITELGLDSQQTEKILEVENNIGLVFSPYSPNLSEWVQKAVDKGFEAFLHLPLQPADYMFDDPGPHSLLIKASPEQNTQRLMQLIAMSDKFVGFVTKPTEIFSKNQSSMRPLISILQENNIELLYSNVRNFGVIENICRDLNADCLFPEFIVDEEVEGDNVYKALRKTQMEAEQKGKAIIYVNSYPQTLKALNRWLGELDVEKYVIVPPSTLLPKS